MKSFTVADIVVAILVLLLVRVMVLAFVLVLVLVQVLLLLQLLLLRLLLRRRRLLPPPATTHTLRPSSSKYITLNPKLQEPTEDEGLVGDVTQSILARSFNG